MARTLIAFGIIAGRKADNDIWIGAGINQLPYNPALSRLYGEDERSFAAIVARIEIGLNDPEPIDGVGKSDLRGDMERRIAIIVPDIGVGILAQQVQKPSRGALSGYDMERTFAAVAVAHIDHR